MPFDHLCTGLPTDSWSQPTQANEWLARIARPPTPKFEAAIPEEEEVKLEESNQAAVSQVGTSNHHVLCDMVSAFWALSLLLTQVTALDAL